MKIENYDIVNPENSESLGEDCTVRYTLSENSYLEIRVDGDRLEIRSSGRYLPFLQIMPQHSNTVLIGLGNRYGASK